VALADAARFSSRAELARRALISVRQRFAATPAAADAAFVLGKMEDDTGQRATALAWYDRYLTEAPSGHFAAEALGRRMLALRALGNASASRQAAEEYLHRFPDGPYVSVAQELSAP
jgi:predicted TPR repeat methyltransferase